MTNVNPNSTPPASTPQDAPHRPADDTEEVYYEGSPLLRGQVMRGSLWLLLSIVLIALAVLDFVFHWHWPWYIPLALVVVAIVLVFIPVIIAKSVRYRVSNYRIDYERGVLSKTIDTLELWHVEDVRFHQSLGDRLLGIGTITVVSHDDTTPLLVMHGIPQPRQLFDQLKQRIIAVKRQRGVVKMDAGGDLDAHPHPAT
jgi:membrane protein YdbS with pleckstrin-like domain